MLHAASHLILKSLVSFLVLSHFTDEQTQAQFKSSEWPASGSENVNTGMYDYEAQALHYRSQNEPKVSTCTLSDQAIIVLEIYYVDIIKQEQ